ncbi:MAG: hypothetical protein K2O45_03095, partial [Oscillospiraceae bacterium]|nr:hypothetical protein [Oscillospiraceae bacterium]
YFMGVSVMKNGSKWAQKFGSADMVICGPKIVCQNFPKCLQLFTDMCYNKKNCNNFFPEPEQMVHFVIESVAG